MAKPKFVRQGTLPKELEILHAIDERFEELEETKTLASLVPQLHERIHALEQRLGRSPATEEGLRWVDEMMGPPKISADEAPEDDDQIIKKKKQKKKKEGPRWNDEMVAPPKMSADEAPEDEDEINNQKKEEMEKMGAEVDLLALAPVERASTKASTKITDTHAKVWEIDEKTLDTQTSEYYTFGESTWDLVIFIGTGALGPLGSVQTFLLAVVNVLMQIVFVAIAYFNFTLPDIDSNSIADTLRWRRSSGHSFTEYSDVAKESLVHRVCKLDKSLQSSGIQVSLLEDINKYLKSDAEGLEGFFTGQILCIVALVCWYLMVAKEVSHALGLHRGIAAMPRGPTKLDTRRNPFTQVTHYRLRTVARRRKVFSAFLLLYRLFAAALLVWVGTFFLVYTVSVTELILNAVALGIILDIDDLLFDALATTPGRHLVHQLDPLPMPSFPRVRGADAKSVFMSMAIPGITLWVYYTMLGPMVTTLENVKLAMCGGNQNFVWILDKRRVAHLSPTFGGGWEVDEESIKTDAIQEGESIGFGLSVNGTRFGVWVSEVSVLSDMSVADLDDLIDNGNSQCTDLANSEPLLNYLRYFLGNESITGCADAAPFCDSITKMPEFAADGGVGFSARMLCSETCGCRDPQGEHISVQGCPSERCRGSSDFTTAIRGGLCIEKNASAMRESRTWRSWIQTIRAYGSSNETLKGNSEALVLAQAMEDHGCGWRANLSAQNISLGGCFTWESIFDWEFKTLENFCPLTCGCAWNTPITKSCPRPFGLTCDRLDECVTVNEQHYCRGFNAESLNLLALYSFGSVLPAYAKEAHYALEVAFAQSVGVDTGFVQVVEKWSWPGTSWVRLFVTDQNANLTEIQDTIYSTPLADYQAWLDGALEASGVPLADLGLTLTHAGDPRGPEGGYGYGYGN